VSHQDQRAGTGGAVRRPQDAGISPRVKGRVKSCSVTPSDDVWEVKRICVSSLSGCLLRALPSPYKGGSPDL
jgi:hypothetical protein